MLVYIVLDLSPGSWRSGDKDLFNNLQVYVSAVRYSSADSTVRIVNSQKIVYDSDADGDLSCVAAFAEENRNEDLSVTPSDLGVALVHRPSTVLIYSLGAERPSHYLKYIKCMFTAQKYSIRIDAFCLRECMSVKMCCRGTGGVYLEEGSSRELLGLLGIVFPEKEVFVTQCQCCSKRIDVGLVCPICLAVYCRFFPVCRRCKTKFTFSSSRPEAALRE